MLSKLFNFYMEEKGYQKLGKMAKTADITRSELLRMLIKRARIDHKKGKIRTDYDFYTDTEKENCLP